MVNDMKYPFFVYYTQEGSESFWVAKSSVLKGCVGQGDSLETAIAELEGNERFWLETAKEVGIPIPEIPKEHKPDFSGEIHGQSFTDGA
jgi:predicted RNase H-like HicB family nuclease